MGLFQINYDRPGPGVNKDEPPKKPFFRFFEIFFRKFWKLVQLNLLFCVPVAIALLFVYLIGRTAAPTFLSMLPFLLVAPFVAGLTMVTRNFAREEHAFVLSDFLEAIQKNWAAFLINGALCLVVYLILSVALSYYSAQISKNFIFFVPFGLCIAIAVLFVFAQYYVPVMVITFDLKLNQVYKNAFIFSIVGLWRNLLLSLLLGVILLGMDILIRWMPLTFLIAAFLLIFNLFAFIMFLINFTVYPLIDKIMIQPYKEKKSDPDDTEDYDK
ncbi:MAG TPA: DUF624 domain-containing protein [Caproiciproducens sp.]|nr:DUF624 domain-containing protein [Caproiciproducens sp.]